jgi:hypothetical protein
MRDVLIIFAVAAVLPIANLAWHWRRWLKRGGRDV